TDAGSARYRVDVRLAALLRMRALLVRVAGQELLREDAAGGERSAQRAALGALEECERGTLGVFEGTEGPFPPDAPETLPPFDEDLAAVRRALPSWLGIRFRPVPEA